MKKNEIMIFNNGEFGQIRTVEVDGEPNFVASDVAKALGYKRPADAVSQHCRYTAKHRIPHPQNADKTIEVNVIPEGDLYRLITHSGLESARKFETWVYDEVLPSIRKNGVYETPKAQAERLASVNNAVKILTPLLERAGCNTQIQLLTAKQLYEKAGVTIPVEIQADKQYFDTVHIARKVGIYYKSSGKPAEKAVNEIIRRLHISEDEYTETWEAKGKWQGTVRKYSQNVIDRVIRWIEDNGCPQDISYTQTDGQEKQYHVIYKERPTA